MAGALMLPSSMGWAITDPTEALPDAALEQRAERIGQALRCAVCQNQSVEDSEADLARDIRHRVRLRVRAGESDARIIDDLAARYGDFIRLRPPLRAATLLLWTAPFWVLLMGGIVVSRLWRGAAR